MGRRSIVRTVAAESWGPGPPSARCGRLRKVAKVTQVGPEKPMFSVAALCSFLSVSALHKPPLSTFCL